MGDPHVANAVTARATKAPMQCRPNFSNIRFAHRGNKILQGHVYLTSLENCTGTTKENVQKNRTILTFDPAKENIFVGVLRLRVTLRQKSPLIEEFEFYY